MIGVFDSGLGGLTVVKEILKQLPGHRVVYFGDTARMPYGTKGPEAIRRFAVEDARLLVKEGAQAIVIACNTASALAADQVRAAVRVPVFEVVTPAVRAAARVSRGHVGVIGTAATVGSGIYPRLLKKALPKARISLQACPLFVPLVEEDWVRQPETQTIANKYLHQLKLRDIDTLILGCTHYPFLRREIRQAVGKQVRLIDPAKETVAELKQYLATHPRQVTKEGMRARHRFLVSDRSPRFVSIASRWLRRPITLELAALPC